MIVEKKRFAIIMAARNARQLKVWLHLQVYGNLLSPSQAVNIHGSFINCRTKTCRFAKAESCRLQVSGKISLQLVIVNVVINKTLKR